MPSGADELAAVVRDLEAEHAALDWLVAGPYREAWELPTPSTGWKVRDQIGPPLVLRPGGGDGGD